MDACQDARRSGVESPKHSVSSRKRIPLRAWFRMDGGTRERPRPAATRLTVDGSCGASCNTAERQAAMTGLYHPGLGGRR